MKIIGDNIKKFLKEKNMSQKEASAILGIIPSRLNQYIKNQREPDQEMIQKFYDKLKLEPNDLYGIIITGKDIIKIPIIDIINKSVPKNSISFCDSYQFNRYTFVLNEATFSQKKIFAIKIEDDSLLPYFTKDTTLICVDINDIYSVPNGKRVVCKKINKFECETVIRKYSKIDDIDETIILFDEINNTFEPQKKGYMEILGMIIKSIKDE